MSFADSFVWGVATASYQIEGAAHEDGRGPSVWDMFCNKPDAVFEGHNGDIACDHYHRYPEDVALMKQLGVGAYRFSIAWPRVMPEGTGAVNKKGVEFYDKLVDSLLAAGIDPYATLYHWDTPQALYHRGGWLNPDSPKWFADYARVVVDALSDRVQHWMTQNEQQCFIGLGMQDGKHAPGDRLRWAEVLQAMHNALLAHGMATRVIRSHAKLKPLIGMAPACNVFMPTTDKPADIEAARKATFAVTSESTWHLAWCLDPVFLGKYPDDGVKLFEGQMPEIGAEDMKTISEPLDFFGMNVYHGKYVKAGDDGSAVELPWKIGRTMTALKWPVTPECLYWAPKFYHERYGKPIVITENGLANTDSVQLDGKVHDPQRVDFLHRHLLQLLRAHQDGVPVQGYFQWSLMDNFEWAEGYKERFGIIHVDYETQQRTPKDSFHWYQQVIRSNGKSLLGSK